MKNWKVKVLYMNLGETQDRREYTIQAKTEKSALKKAYQIIGNREAFITHIEPM